MRAIRIVLCGVFLLFGFSAVAEQADLGNPFDRHPIHFAAVNGVSIAYQDMGPKEAKPVILVMGLGAQMLHWGDTLVEGLLENGYRVVLLDNRDAGLSQKFYDLSAPPVWWMLLKDKVGLAGDPPYTLNDMAGDVVGLMDVLEIQRANIVGASMGGMIVQTLAAEYPQRVISVTSIMSSSGAPGLPEAEPDALQALASAAGGSSSRREKVEKGVQISRALGSPAYFDEAHARQMVERIANRGSYSPGMLRQLQAVLASGDRSELLGTISVPALVVHGEDDPLLPLAHGRDTAEKIPGARFVAIPGMAHVMQPEPSELVLRELLPFLQSQAAVAAQR